jgi:putative tryptophan/tyrosine transport system substrate-binding protein
LAADLVRLKVDVIVTSGGTQIARVAQAATTTIPIVFAAAGDPVRDRLVKSINRPGGNSTGTDLLNNSLTPKRLEVLRELVPTATSVGFLVNPRSASTEGQIRDFEAATRPVGVQVHVVNASTEAEIEMAFATLVERGVTALIMGADPFFQVQQQQLVRLAAQNRLPTVYEWPEFVQAGGLIAYSVDRIEVFRQLGAYVSRILNGASPFELPIIQPTKFELVINLKTARALGLKVSESFLQRADQVIE